MRTPCFRKLRHWLSSACVAFALAASTTHAVDLPTDIVIPLNERLLTHLEKTATGLAAREQGDRALKKDFKACMQDKKVAGTTIDEIAASMAARHPQLAAALTAEGWTVKDFYLTYLTLLTMPYMSELSRGGVPDDNRRVRQNVIFYDKHKARVSTLIAKMNPLTGLEGKKN